MNLLFLAGVWVGLLIGLTVGSGVVIHATLRTAPVRRRL